MMDEPVSELRTHPSLLVRIRDSADADAWKTFVSVYTPVIGGYCRRRGTQDADAADITQEVLVQVAHSIHQFTYQPERGRFRDWLGTVTRNKLNRFQQRHARREVADNPEALLAVAEAKSPGHDADWDAEFEGGILRAAMDRRRADFDPHTWRAFELVWLEERPASEVARQLGLGVEAVYVAKSRVLKRLREEVLLLAEDLPGFVPLG